jgi:MSHA pilin protein MshC
MKMIEKKIKNQHGFTMIEVISVLIIIGIIAAVAIIRMTNTSEFDLASQVEVIKGHLRLAQSRAMGTGSPWGINFNTATTYHLFQGSATTTPVLLLGEDNVTVNLTAKKSKLSITSAPLVITFDAYGSPGSNTINLVTSAGNITITGNTGFIP